MRFRLAEAVERRQRIVFAAIAALIAVVAVVVLAGGRDAETERADRPPATATGTSTPVPQEAEPQATATPTPTATATREPIETIRYRGGRVAGGLAKLRFEKGDTVRFAVASDVAEEVHVHGYDVTKDVEAGGTVRFSFPAEIEGIFEVELEGSHAQVAQLRVDP